MTVLGNPTENFDLDLFFERYPEAIGYVLKIKDISSKRITEWDNAIADYFNYVESNDDEEAPRAPANKTETTNKDNFESKDLAELCTSSLPERRSSENEDSLFTRVGKMFRFTPWIKNLKKYF